MTGVFGRWRELTASSVLVGRWSELVVGGVILIVVPFDGLCVVCGVWWVLVPLR